MGGEGGGGGVRSCQTLCPRAALRTGGVRNAFRHRLFLFMLHNLGCFIPFAGLGAAVQLFSRGDAQTLWLLVVERREQGRVHGWTAAAAATAARAQGPVQTLAV